MNEKKHIFVENSTFNKNYRLTLPNRMLVTKRMNEVEKKRRLHILSHRHKALIMSVTVGTYIMWYDYAIILWKMSILISDHNSAQAQFPRFDRIFSMVESCHCSLKVFHQPFSLIFRADQCRCVHCIGENQSNQEPGMSVYTNKQNGTLCIYISTVSFRGIRRTWQKQNFIH